MANEIGEEIRLSLRIVLPEIALLLLFRRSIGNARCAMIDELGNDQLKLETYA